MRVDGSWTGMWEHNKRCAALSSRLVGLHLENVLAYELLAISRNWLILREVPAESAKPQMLKHQNTGNKRHG